MITAIQILATAEEWAGAIGRARNKAVDSILEMGNLLIQAKAALEHGEFSRMFTDSEARVGRPPVADPLPFSRTTAAKFMAIATHPGLAKDAHARLLPSSWGTLYELTTLPADVLEAKLETGEINPTIQRKDIKRWKEPEPEPRDISDEFDEEFEDGAARINPSTPLEKRITSATRAVFLAGESLALVTEIPAGPLLDGWIDDMRRGLQLGRSFLRRLEDAKDAKA